MTAASFGSRLQATCRRRSRDCRDLRAQIRANILFLIRGVNRLSQESRTSRRPECRDDQQARIEACRQLLPSTENPIKKAYCGTSNATVLSSARAHRRDEQARTK